MSECKFKRGDHIKFTNVKNILIYNAVILNDVYIKGKGFFYEVLSQEYKKDNINGYDMNKIYNNYNFNRTWYIYKDNYDNNISLPFIKRGRDWIYFENNIKQNPYYFREMCDVKEKYKISFFFKN